ncbi:PDI protein A prpA [Metarhizium album ARSEF 1941]|uniref:protein disulfide-isomerase n=1 Tax=Metarhizium album (strain ARSEF 1941) TaxID=1081103 RepID=A0A0B2WNL1_METAS|nr:PDI protein A prpA [Metarhizium album ARSEF 1941]KHN95568.1 PDI protein A prpA [Metarhizium album ARSEF 1941]
MRPPRAVAGLTALLAAVPSVHASYSKNPFITEVNANTYHRQISKSNHTSVILLYAPWCIHCKNLKPALEKAADNLDGAVKIATVNCDDDMNKQLCASMGVQGFPTIKIVRPGKKPGSKPITEDYQGARTSAAIVQAARSKINNHVTKVTDKDLDVFLERDGPKAILFTEKETTSALLRSLAIDFLGVISVAQVRNKEEKTVEKFGIDKFPAFILIPARDKEPFVYDGDLKKKDMIAFLRQAGEPNPDPAPAKPKAKGDKKPPKSSKKAQGQETKAASSAKSEADEAATTPEASTETSTNEPAASTQDVTPITTIAAKDTFVEKCLGPKSRICVLAFIPAHDSENGARVTDSLAQLNTKYVRGNRQVFTFLVVPSDVEGLDGVRRALGLEKDVELIAFSARRSWWRQYEGDFDAKSVNAWLDDIRMGEGAKKKLPEEVIAVAEVVEKGSDQKADAGEDQRPAEKEVKHEEL